jgi:glycosyltransferase involved in cell wall biosynthesis
MPEDVGRQFPKLCIVGLPNLRILAPDFIQGRVGGAERQQVKLAKALVGRGFEVAMIVHDEGQPDGKAWDGITTYAAYDPSDGIAGLRFVHPRSTGLWSAMKRANADIYYLSCATMHLGIATLFARRHARKVVFRVASNMDCDPQLPDVGDWRHKAMFRYGLRRADAVLAQTLQQQGMLTRLGRSSRVVAPLTDVARSDRPRQHRDLQVLWINNFRATKRADLLLELARRMPDVRFEMVGGAYGREPAYEQAKNEAATLPNVHFHGYLPHEQTAALYPRARVLVSTSEIEGFPNTYLQAWASGTPVIGFFDPDQTIARNGLGHAVRSLDEMQRMCADLLADDVKWDETSARCRDYAASVMDENNMLVPYIETFMALR